MSRKPKPEKHHWWPKGVSEFWKGDDGLTGMIRHDHEDIRSNPKNFGVIGGGHHVKLDKQGNDPTPWDECFEDSFQRADDNLPNVIRWLEVLDRKWIKDAPTKMAKLIPQPISDVQTEHLVEGLVSLVVRSPRFRERAASLAEHFRGPLPEKERNTIIGFNLRHCQRMFADNFGVRGKFAVLYSPNKEFIFGDGFFTNISSTSSPPSNPTILAPLTPLVSVLYSIPPSYSADPKLVTIMLDQDEAEFLNDTVQVYAKDYLFYRTRRPEITEPFNERKHLVYGSSDHPIARLVNDISGSRNKPPNYF